MIVMLRRNWPGGKFGRTVRLGKDQTERLEFTAGEPVEVDGLYLEGLQADIGHALVEVHETRPGKFVQTTPDAPEPVYEEPSNEIVEEAAPADVASETETANEEAGEDETDAGESVEAAADGEEPASKGKGGRRGRK